MIHNKAVHAVCLSFLLWVCAAGLPVNAQAALEDFWSVQKIQEKRDFYHGEFPGTSPVLMARLNVSPDTQKEDPIDSLPREAIEFKNLAEKYEEKGELQKAEKLYLQSMRVIVKSLGNNHPVSAFALINLADLYIQMKDFLKAEPMYLRSLIIINNSMGPDHFFAALVLNNIGGMYKKMKEFNKAESMYLRSLEIHESSLGPNHPNVAVPLNNLAELYRMMGNDKKAEPYFLRALDIYNESKNHPN